jgi:AcrR family transcriptional regulator
MSSKIRRKKEREEVRQKILDAARALFVAQGVEAVSMRKIAAKIDYTATALYTHFKDKESLLRELCDADFRAFRGALERAAEIADPVERLRALGKAYIAFARGYPNHYRLMFMTPQPPRDPDESEIERGNPDQDAYAFLRATIAEGLEAGRYREEFRDADLLAQVIWSGAHGLVALHLTKSCDAWFNWHPFEETAEAVIDVMIRGVVREEEAR